MGFVYILCQQDTEAAEIFDDESNFFHMVSLVWYEFCVASYKWVGGLIYPEDNDILADDKWQLYANKFYCIRSFNNGFEHQIPFICIIEYIDIGKY